MKLVATNKTASESPSREETIMFLDRPSFMRGGGCKNQIDAMKTPLPLYPLTYAIFASL